MGFKHSNHRTSSSPNCISIRSSTIFAITLILFSSLYLFPSISRFSESGDHVQSHFNGDLRDARLPWNKLCFGRPVPFEKLKLAVFSKSWPMIGAAPGGMERHALTLYTVLAARGHEIHVFTVPSDRRPHQDLHQGNLHVYFAANDHGSVNLSLAFDIFNQVKMVREFDYVHTESVSLPHWRAKAVAKVAVTWHGIWYEIMYSNVFQELLSNKSGLLRDPSYDQFQESMPRLINEIRFFPSYTQHICITNSAGEALVNVYQIPQRNVHVILNGVDETKFVQDPEGGARFRKKHGVPDDASLVMGVAGRLVRDKGHPLLHEAFSVITKRNPGVFLLVAGSGPWGTRYAELGANVKVLGALESSELSEFYNALDVFVNPTLRPQGLDLTLMEAMLCGKTILTPNFPSITGTLVLNEDFGYTFAPNVGSFVEALEKVIRDGSTVLQRKGMVCKKYAVSMFTANKMASAYERFFLCMKNPRYCHYPLETDC